MKELVIYTFDEHKEGRAFISVLILIRTIEAAVPEGRIQSIGGQDLVISYKPESPSGFSFFYKLKILLICMTCFFGTGISIMQYNNDVDTSRIFARLYEIFYLILLSVVLTGFQIYGRLASWCVGLVYWLLKMTAVL